MVQVVCTHDSEHTMSPLLIFFSGEGGTGKNFVLKALVQTLNHGHGINPKDRNRSIVKVGAAASEAEAEAEPSSPVLPEGIPISEDGDDDVASTDDDCRPCAASQSDSDSGSRASAFSRSDAQA